MKTLTNGQRIKSADMNGAYKVTFHLVKWTGEYDETLEHWNKRAGVTTGIAAYSCNAGCSITADYEGKKEAMAKDRAEFESAPVIEDGEIVICDGFAFKAKFNGKQYSDPFSFEQIIESPIEYALARA